VRVLVALTGGSRRGLLSPHRAVHAGAVGLRTIEADNGTKAKAISTSAT
jgi:hypothetical protein